MSSDRRCDYCKNKAMYVCDYLDSKGEWHMIAGCDKHGYEAAYRQKSIAGADSMKGRWILRDSQSITINTYKA